MNTLRFLRLLSCGAALAGLACASHPGAGRPPAPASRPSTRPAEPLANIAYEIAPWFLFYDGALSLTFDGDDQKVMAEVYPLLSDRERPIGATFFVDPRKVGKAGRPGAVGWDDLRRAAEAGYEIASRPAAADDVVLAASREQIRREVPGRPCLTLAYPGGAFTPEAVRHYRAGLLTGRHYQYRDYPKSFLRLEDDRLEKGSVDGLKHVIETVLEQHGWAIVSYGARGDDFKDQTEMILDYHPRLWDAAVGDVVRYVMEAQTARLALVDRSPDAMTLRLTDRLPEDDVFNHPLSVEIALPDGWKAFTAEQASRPVWHGVVRGRARFNAVPDSGDVVLRRAGAGVAPEDARGSDRTGK